MKYQKLSGYRLYFIFLVLFSIGLNAQGIGDNLAFQGLVNQDAMHGVKARALGNAIMAVSGNINSIFYNPAGLADIDGLQISFSAKNQNRKTFERQQFIPVGGAYGIMELIWAGIYIPQLENDGVRSDEILYDRSNFVQPDSAVDYFDEDFADWVKEDESSGLNNIIAAYPFKAFDRQFVASAAYSRSSIFDFDRNDHVLGVDYGENRIVADSNWYMYSRQRKGTMNNVVAALATNLNEKINLGISFEYMWGNSDDKLSNDIFAHMQITQQQNPNRALPGNTYYFWHDSTEYGISGKSDFSYLKIGLGVLYKTEKFSAGLRINLPYSLNNDYSYQEYKIVKPLRDSTATAVRENGNQISGTNSFSTSFSIAAGVSVKPLDFVKVNLDYQYRPFSNGSYDFSGYDSTKSQWTSSLPKIKSFQTAVKAIPNLNSFHAGLEIQPIEYISLLGGYSFVTEEIRPEDHFKAEKVGTTTSAYSVGLCIYLPYVELSFAYQWKDYKYIDYYSYHTDYVKWETQNLYSGITVRF